MAIEFRADVNLEGESAFIKILGLSFGEIRPEVVIASQNPFLSFMVLQALAVVYHNPLQGDEWSRSYRNLCRYTVVKRVVGSLGAYEKEE